MREKNNIRIHMKKKFVYMSVKVGGGGGGRGGSKGLSGHDLLEDIFDGSP